MMQCILFTNINIKLVYQNPIGIYMIQSLFSKDVLDKFFISVVVILGGLACSVAYIVLFQQGLLGLYGTHDSKGVPIVLSSCNDKSVKLYSLPLFSERGRTFSKGEVRSLRAAPGGLLFTGDEAKADQSLEMALKRYCPTNFNYMFVN